MKAYFLSYVKKTVQYSAIKFKQKNSNLYNHEKMILTTSKEDEEDKINTLIDKNIDIDKDAFTDFNNFCETFENIALAKNFQTLTQKQKEVIFEVIINETSERDLAKKLNTSFQNVNKIKRTAFKKLKVNLLNTNEDAK
ncbi:sigma-70 family RNA polymerase sigma factor [Gottschalkia acidurici]|nr:sigma-70 family RNA polymerase sigma factor [Gottschalkia acidurici]